MRALATNRKMGRDKDTSRGRHSMGCTALLLILGCTIFACIYQYVIPFLTGFDTCLSTLLAPQEVAAIRARYEAFRALVIADRFEEAYQFMTPKYRRARSLGYFKEDAGVISVPELSADSSIFVCDDFGDLTNIKYEGFISYGEYVSLVKLNGQWYFDDVSYSPD